MNTKFHEFTTEYSYLHNCKYSFIVRQYDIIKTCFNEHDMRLLSLQLQSATLQIAAWAAVIQGAAREPDNKYLYLHVKNVRFARCTLYILRMLRILSLWYSRVVLRFLKNNENKLIRNFESSPLILEIKKSHLVFNETFFNSCIVVSN